MDEERAAAAFAAEIAYYLEHHLEGSDRERLDDLRDRCAEVMMSALELPGLDHATAREVMLGVARVRALPGRRCPRSARAARGHAAGGGEQLGLLAARTGCGRAGLLEHVDGVVTSAEVGRGQARSRASSSGRWSWPAREPGEAVHVGDSLENDVAGARAAGIRPVLVARDGAAPGGVEAVRSLAELPALL